MFGYQRIFYIEYIIVVLFLVFKNVKFFKLWLVVIELFNFKVEKITKNWLKLAIL